MLEKLRYQNHLGEMIDFGADGIYVLLGDMHDYMWEAVTRNGRISALERMTATRRLPVVIMCETEEAGIAARNRLHDLTERDVLAFQYGKIFIGDYYFRCFVTGSSKQSYLAGKRHMALTLTLTTDFPCWVKETSTIFAPASLVSKGTGLDYAHDYPHDYTMNSTGSSLHNDGLAAADFRLMINGPCYHPAVHVNGHMYQVNCELSAGEYLTIDSQEKTIMLTTEDGQKINCFNDRNKGSYVFQKIPTGMNVVYWPGDFTFEFILLDERSEPKWT